MTLPSISLSKVSKAFPVYDAKRPSTLRHALSTIPRLPQRPKRFLALKGIDLDVGKGEMVGIIGHNGSGKSTLLRLVGKVLKPDRGRVSTIGRVGALMDLNVGMHSELSGRENILIGGVVAGLTLREITAELDRIIEFGELRHVIDAPLRTYSAGMRLRLGFAVATHTRPDVLLIDEVLAVGDLSFQRKCEARIRDLQRAGTAVLLVTHDIEQVKNLCDRAVWLERGRVVAAGLPTKIARLYREHMHRRSTAATPKSLTQVRLPNGLALTPGRNRFGTQACQIVGFKILDTNHQAISRIDSGEGLVLVMTVKGKVPNGAIANISMGRVEDDTVEEAFDVNTELDQIVVPSGESMLITLELQRLDLQLGDYAISAGIFTKDWAVALDYHWRSYGITIESDRNSTKVFNPLRRWKINAPNEGHQLTSR